jgi:DNA-binding protein H-NS
MINLSNNMAGSTFYYQGYFESKMKSDDLQSMSLDELWTLYEAVVAQLSQKAAAELAGLDRRLRQLGTVPGNPKRPYPKVPAKYRNPNDHNETWTGRGKQPRWLRDQIRSGKQLTDFLIR